MKRKFPKWPKWGSEPYESYYRKKQKQGEIEDKVLFDCGCIIGRDGEMFVIIPCSIDCKVLKYCLEESKKRGNPIHFVESKRNSK